MSLMKRMLAVLTAMLCLISAGCTKGNGSDIPDLETSLHEEEAGSPMQNALTQTLPDSSETDTEPELTKADLDTDWNETDATIVFSGESVTPSVSEGVSVENGVVTITKGGTYVLSGSLEYGRTVVDLDDKSEKVHLVFNGVSIHSGSNSPLTILKADKAVITLAKNSVNTLSDSASYDETNEENASKACISSKCDLTINGTGTLTVSGNGNNGIHCKDDLKIVSGTVNVESENHGIRGNDTVLIHSGIVSVKAGGDGIKTTTEDKEGKGRIVIQGGHLNVTSAQDGLEAATNLLVSGGTIEIESGGGAENAEPHKDSEFGFGGRNSFSEEQQNEEDSEPSRKGIKAAGSINLKGGSILVNAADDAVHSDGNAGIGGEAVLKLRSGDDGIHAEKQLCITENASVTVSESYEGFEAYEILISGGETRVRSSDDGLNASGTEETTNNGTAQVENTAFGGRGGFGGMNAGSDGNLSISGGYLFVNADGDGIDSNGDIEMTGGTVVVCGPTSNMNGPLDCGDRQNTIKVTGGTLMAVGSTGMMDVPEENYIAATDLNAAAGTTVIVTDSDGKVLGALKTPKQAAGVIFSANGMNDGYQVYSGAEYDGTLNEDGFGTGGSCSGGKMIKSGSGGGGMGGFGGGRPGRGNGNDPFNGERPQMPGDGSEGFPQFSNGDIPKYYEDGSGHSKTKKSDRKTEQHDGEQASESVRNNT